MSLRIGMNAATSALRTTQAQMALTSTNIANADTAGYTRKVATVGATTTQGQVTGVTLTGIESTLSKALLKDLSQAAAANGEAAAVADFAGRLGSLLGAVEDDGSGTSLAVSMDAFEAALSALSDSPESTTLTAETVAALDDLAAKLRATSTGVQGLREDADDDLAAAVATVNAALEEIASLNDRIQRVAGYGESTADLEDQRNAALTTLSEQMSVTWFVDDHNALKVYTSSGTALVDSQAHPVAYQSAGTIRGLDSYPGTLSGLTVGSKDITEEIKSGTIAGLLTMRDETLPAVQDELDALAARLIETVNTLTNGGTASPAPGGLTGTTAVVASDALGGSGILRVAVVDDGGTVQSHQDIDLSLYATVGDLVTALDSLSGLSASLDAEGHLTITADTDGQGVALNEMDSAIGGQGASAFFGLNDALAGSGAEDIRLSAALAADGSRLPTAALSSDPALADGDDALDDGDTTTVQALLTTLSEDHAFAAAGGLAATETSFSGYASSIVSAAATALDQAESAQTGAETARATVETSIAARSGVNLDEETARLEALRNAYEAAASVMEALNEMFDALLGMVQ
jgi:flagellar hook-associated protein 1 FlgK